MNKLLKEPATFKTQREAFWYRQGLRDAKESVNHTLRLSIAKYDLEWLDHLPTGDEENE